jgi:hypothetical protein
LKELQQEKQDSIPRENTQLTRRKNVCGIFFTSISFFFFSNAQGDILGEKFNINYSLVS